MPSTFFGLTIASSGLRAANAALNTTANNVSNVDTAGYSRQAVTTEAANALRVFAKYGCAGAGVETIAIERIRDKFYDIKFRENETRLGEYDVKAYYMRMIEEYLTDDKVSGFKTIFDKIGNALQEITKDGSSTSVKSQFVSTVKNLTDYFNNMYGNLQNMQADVNDEIKMRVDEINSLAQELAIVNKQINVIEMRGTVANELRDKRDLMLDQLSAIVDVKTEELPLLDQAGNETGGSRFIIRIAGGQTLVDQNEYRQLECIARQKDEKVNQSDVDGLYDIKWTDGIDFGLYNDILGGELKGLVQMRDGNNGEYFNGRVDATYYSYESTKVVIETSAEYLGNMNKCNLSDTGGTINIGNQVYYYTEWNYEGDNKYSFVIDNLKSDQPLLNGQYGKEASVGSDVRYQGVPYYMAQMNEWLRDFAKTINDIFTQGVTASGEDAGILLTGDILTSNGQYTEDWLNGLSHNDKGKRNDKGYYHITAGNFAVNQELIKDASLLGTRSDPTKGVEECEQVKKVISMLSDTNQFAFRGRNAGGFLECVLSDAALSGENANTFYDTYLSLETAIDNQRISISGVDEDEEAVSLVKYQNSYTLASKMISTLT